MSVALFSTAYFPPVAYMAALKRFDKARVEVKETFPKQTYRNRMLIMTSLGVKTLSVPVLRSNHSRTEEVAIDYKDRWNVIHLRSLKTAYAASPYWFYYQDDVEALIMARYDRLVDLNNAVTDWAMQKTGVACRLEATRDYCVPDGSPDDYRYRLSPKVPLPPEGFPLYYQVFADRQPFTPNLSVLDLLANLGPEAGEYLTKVSLRYG